MMTKQLLSGSLIILFLSNFAFAQWSTSPMVNNQVSFLPGDQTQCYVATHSNGDTYISWFSSEAGGNYYPRVQLFDIEGNQQWANDGILVSNHPSMTWITDYDMTVSSDGGCVISFQDTRTGNNDAFIYKLSPEGEFLWGDDGIQLSNDASFDANPLVLATGDGGAYVAWPKLIDNGDSKVIVQRITPAGEKAWSSDLELWESGYDYTWPQLLSDGNGGILLTWYKEWGPAYAPNRIILSQRFNASGVAVWSTPSILFPGSYIPIYIHPQAVSDGDGGAWVCWYYEQISNHLSTFVQHVDENGSIAFPSGSLEVSANMGTLHLEPELCCNTDNQDAFIFWRETNTNQSQFGLYGQRIDLGGNRLWGNNGQQFVGIGSQNPILINLSPLGSGGVVTYIYNAAVGMNGSVKAIRFDEAGNQVWTTSPVDVSSIPSPKGKLDAGEYLSGQMIVAWADERNGNNDIFAQNVSETGALGPLTYEFTIIPDTLFFLTPESYTDGVPFTITNTGDNPFDITYIQPYGAPVGNFTMWFIDPPVTSYPITLNPGEDLTETVFWIVTDGYPGTTVFDTLEIHLANDTVNLIIAADSTHIWIITGDHPVTDTKLFPNPFSEMVTIQLKADSPTHVTLEVVTSLFIPVTTLLNNEFVTGDRKVTWNGTDKNGHRQPPGCYFMIIRTPDSSLIHKIIRL